MKKYRLKVVGLVIGVLFAGAAFAAMQNVVASDQVVPSTAPPAPHAQFFAGTVVELDAAHIKVARTLVGRPTESRNFTVNASTKMNKTVIKMHTRVTVRYKHLSEGDLALEIQLRPVMANKPKS